MRFNIQTKATILASCLAGSSLASPRNSPSALNRSAKYAIFKDLATIVGDARFHAVASDKNKMAPKDSVIVVHNSGDIPMHLFVENDNKILNQSLIALPAHQWFMLYDLPHADGVNGAIQALLGCDEHGDKCASVDGTLSKFEWTAGSNNDHDTWTINLSLVDGYNLGMEVFLPAGGDCSKKHVCHVPQEVVKNQCPKSKLHSVVKDGETYHSCHSDCKAWGQSCDFGQRGNRHLADYCPNVYWDNAENPNETCHPGGVILLRLKV